MLSNNNNLVELVGTTAPNTTVHQWVPKNVKSMNRRNKMSSEVFKVPACNQDDDQGGSGEGGYEFRLVLLRGVVRADSELDDPLAVFLEYIPPTTHNDDDSSASSTQQQHVHPEGCKVAVWCVKSGRVPASSSSGSMFAAGELEEEETGTGGVVPTRVQLPRGDPHLYVEETFTFNGSTKMLGFKEFIPAIVINNDCFVDPSALNAMIIRVEITTGVSSVADVVARTTDRWSSSLWGSATSVFAVVQASIDVVSSNVKGWLDGEVEGRTEQVEEPAIESQRGLPWGELPPKWNRAGKTLEDWATLISIQLPEDEGTFLFGAERGINPDEQVLMTQIGLQHRQILSAASVFDYNRDVHEGLLTCSRIREQRYELVPGRISDERFWANYMWKVAALATCINHDQVQLILSILNAPPAPSPRRGSRDASLSRPTNASRGGVLDDSFHHNNHHNHEDAAAGGGGSVADVEMDGESILASQVGATVREALEVKDVLFELLEGYKDTRGADAESDEVLIQSAKKSCEKQRERLVAMMGRASAAATKRGESEQDCALCAGLHSTLRSVDDAVESIETTVSLVKSLQQDGGSGSASTETEVNDDEPAEEEAVNEEEEVVEEQPEHVHGEVTKEEAPTTATPEAPIGIDDDTAAIEATSGEVAQEEIVHEDAPQADEEIVAADTDDQQPDTTEAQTLDTATTVDETNPDGEVETTTPDLAPQEEVVDQVQATIQSEIPVEESESKTTAATTTVTTTPAAAAVVVDDGSDFDELPDIDATSPTGIIPTTATHVDPQATAASTPLTASVTSPTGSMASKGGASARKIEFEPMPWDDEE